MTSTCDERSRRPARTSTGVALALTGVGFALVFQQVPELAGPAAIGGGGAVCLAVALWLVSGTETPQSGFVASLLAVPISAGIAGGLYTAGLVLVEGIFPVDETALLSVGALVVVGHAGVVLGSTIAALGVALAVHNVTHRDPLRRYTRVTFAAGGAAVVTALLLVTLAVLSGTTPGLVLTTLASTVPGIGLLAVAAGALCYGLWLLVRGWSVAGRLSPPVRGGVVGGALTTGVVAAAGPSLYTGLVEETASRFPAEVAVQIRDVALGPADLLGEATVLVLLAVFFLGVTAWLLFVLRFVLSQGYLSEQATGPSLSGAGLFLSTLFVGTVGAPRWLVVVGVAASLAVWDAGRFGATLTQEVGHGEWGPELVHAGATVLVGAVGVLVALALGSRLTGVSGDSASVLTLWSLVVGLVLLTVALQR